MFTVPALSCKAMEALEKKELIKGVRSEIVSVVADEIWQYTQFINLLFVTLMWEIL